MNDPTGTDIISDTRMQIIALVRATSNEHADIGAVDRLVDKIDHRVGLVVAARFIGALVKDLAHLTGRSAENIRAAMSISVVNAADPDFDQP